MFSQRRCQREIVILAYHNVGDVQDDFWTVPQEDFESQLRYLKAQGYESVLPGDLVEHLAGRRPLPPHPVILTFDDGFLSAKTMVDPLLAKYGFRGIVYLVTDLVADTPGTRREFEGKPCLVWPEVRTLQADGRLTVGGHSVHHYHLDRLADPSSEVRPCAEDIARKGGLNPDSFCYPFGDKNAAVMTALQEAGFTTAMTVNEWRLRLSHRTNLLKLPRFWVRGGHHEFTARCMANPSVPGGMNLVVSHQGIPIDVILRVVCPDLRRSESWLAVKEFGSGERTWPWKPTDPGVRPESVRIEVWDRNRFFQLY